MGLKMLGELNHMYGKSLSEETKDKIRQKALGRIFSEETKLNMSKASQRANPVNIYEKCSSEGFKFIGSFVSARRAAKFLEISGSTSPPLGGSTPLDPFGGYAPKRSGSTTPKVLYIPFIFWLVKK